MTDMPKSPEGVALCKHGHMDPHSLCVDCEANSTEAEDLPFTHQLNVRRTHPLEVVVSRDPMGEGVRETLESIRDWAHGTFGVGTLDKLIARAGEEWDELHDATTPDDKEIEAADVVICLLAAPGVLDAVQRKMAINRGRTWNTKGDGVGYHVKTSALSTNPDNPNTSGEHGKGVG